MVHAPAQHFLRILEHEPVIGEIGGEIVKLVGIGLQIEKQRRQAGKMDVLVAPVPDQICAALIGRQSQRPAAVKPGKMAKCQRRSKISPKGGVKPVHLM